ncbi:hypothetical protein QE152_g6722 [Popillia japonica]|uniref:Uncharacterized protein n=1 Tax=Popillia japonica TaxID=7064 RepID=A0AAW1MH75_POPJA
MYVNVLLIYSIFTNSVNEAYRTRKVLSKIDEVLSTSPGTGRSGAWRPTNFAGGPPKRLLPPLGPFHVPGDWQKWCLEAYEFRRRTAEETTTATTRVEFIDGGIMECPSPKDAANIYIVPSERSKDSSSAEDDGPHSNKS